MHQCGLTSTPGEAHGIAVGLLAGDVPDRERHWAEVLYADLDPADALAQECRACLDALLQATTEQAQDLQFGLQLYLPGEEDGDAGRSAALRDWVQGFLYGFGLAGGSVAAAQLSTEAQEVLRDLYEIGQLQVSDEALDEDDQQALAEIEEYVRVAAMLVHEDMHARRPGGELSNEIH